MANRLRFRSGQVQLVKVPVLQHVEIDVGDLVYLWAGKAFPLSQFPDDWVDLSDRRKAVPKAFLGIAHQSTASGETEHISVDLSPLAVYEMDVEADTYELGVPLEPCLGMSQCLRQSRDSHGAIARAAEYKATRSTLLRVSFCSAFHPASANRYALIG
jgi:hypothetical protein